MPQLQLSYVERKPIRWYQHRWVYKPVIFLAVLWLGWIVAKAVPPYWYRYRYYQLQQQAIQFPTTPDQILLDYSPPGPAISHAAASVARFQNRWWASRSSAGLGTVTGPMLSATPIFCHLLKTSKGSERMVQIYAQILPTSGGGQTLALLATSCSILDRSWIILPPMNSFNLAFTSMDFATAELRFGALKSLTVRSGAVVPSDPSIVEIELGLDGQTYPIRTHLVDDFNQSPLPQFAMEGVETIMRRHACASYGMCGFYEWPIAPSSAGN